MLTSLRVSENDKDAVGPEIALSSFLRTCAAWLSNLREQLLYSVHVICMSVIPVHVADPKRPRDRYPNAQDVCSDVVHVDVVFQRCLRSRSFPAFAFAAFLPKDSLARVNQEIT